MSSIWEHPYALCVKHSHVLWTPAGQEALKAKGQLEKKVSFYTPWHTGFIFTVPPRWSDEYMYTFFTYSGTYHQVRVSDLPPWDLNDLQRGETSCQGLTVFRGQEGNRYRLSLTPCLSSDLMPGCECPAGERTRAALDPQTQADNELHTLIHHLRPTHRNICGAFDLRGNISTTSVTPRIFITLSPRDNSNVGS